MAKRNRSNKPTHRPRRLSVSNPEQYRLVITYPSHDRTRHFHTSDLARARHIARRNAREGAHVAFQTHQDWGVYTTTRTYEPETAT